MSRIAVDTAPPAAQLADVRQLLAKARRSSKRLPAADVERRIRGALKTVRGRR